MDSDSSDSDSIDSKIRNNLETLQSVLSNDDTLSKLLIGSHQEPYSYDGYFTSIDAYEHSQLGAAIGINTHITKLTIDPNQRELDSLKKSDFLDGLKRNSSIRKLEIEMCDIGCQAIASILASPNCNLRSLALFCMRPKIDDGGATYLVNGLTNNTKLQELNLARNDIGNAGCESIASLLDNPNCNLQKLSLYKNNIDDKGAITLANGLANYIKLQELVLDGNSIGNAGCEAIASLLGNSNCNLQELILSLNYIDDEGAITLANGLANNTKLQELDLARNPINNIDNAVVEAFSRVLCNTSSVSSTYSSNHTLKVLEISTYDVSMGRNHHVTCSQLKYLLKLNSNTNKRHVAIQKILKYHPNIDMEQLSKFGTEDESNIKALPYVVEWFDKAITFSKRRRNKFNISQRKLSAIYQFVQAMPLLFIPPSMPTLIHRNTRDQLDADMNALEIENGALRQQIEKLEKEIDMKDMKITSIIKDKEKLDDELIANNKLERNTEDQRSLRWREVLRRRIRLSWPRSKRS